MSQTPRPPEHPAPQRPRLHQPPTTKHRSRGPPRPPPKTRSGGPGSRHPPASPGFSGKILDFPAGVGGVLESHPAPHRGRSTPAHAGRPWGRRPRPLPAQTSS
eukprot:120189-Pyramimonas_sp.AAC.2